MLYWGADSENNNIYDEIIFQKGIIAQHLPIIHTRPLI